MIACFPYILPIADGAEFGRYIYERAPAVGLLERATVQPLVNIFHAVPFSSLIIFVAFSFAARQVRLDEERRTDSWSEATARAESKYFPLASLATLLLVASLIADGAQQIRPL